MKIPFSKYHANGNDFVLIQDENIPDRFRKPRIISRLCNRRFGIGADGLFIVSLSDKYDFFLDYYNSDGSWETLCANGSRCAAHFMYNKNLAGAKLIFGTGDGKHNAKIKKNGSVVMSMRTPSYKSDKISPEGISGFFVDSGARHFVCETTDLGNEFALKMGKKIRNSDFFKPRGINVNFYQQIKRNYIKIKTYEKGVEQVMLSCASGSTAVVFHLSQIGAISSPVTTASAGGKLAFTFDKNWEDVWVKGPTEFLFSGDFDAGVLI